MRNQTSFRLTTTLLPTDTTAKTTTVINKLDASGNKFYPTFTEETVVITNDDRTIMETTRATCNNGVLTFVKRGLSDDLSETQITNRKLTWNPGSLCFITAGAGDWIDKDDDVTWTGNQTYTGSSTYQGMLITQKGVKYPNFANVTALEAYASPYGGMFATVDDTGELYRYNAVTEQRDLVSTVELSQYILRKSDTAPAAGTADNIVTLSPAQHGVYVGTDVVFNADYVRSLLPSIGWTTFTSMLERCYDYGSRHVASVSRSTDNTGWASYTVNGYGWFDCGTSTARGATVKIRVNGIILHTETSSEESGFASERSYKTMTCKPGDIIEVYCSGYSGSAGATIYDYY